jgi:hypothetical protein
MVELDELASELGREVRQLGLDGLCLEILGVGRGEKRNERGEV